METIYYRYQINANPSDILKEHRFGSCVSIGDYFIIIYYEVF